MLDQVEQNQVREYLSKVDMHNSMVLMECQLRELADVIARPLYNL